MRVLTVLALCCQRPAGVNLPTPAALELPTYPSDADMHRGEAGFVAPVHHNAACANIYAGAPNSHLAHLRAPSIFICGARGGCFDFLHAIQCYQRQRESREKKREGREKGGEGEQARGVTEREREGLRGSGTLSVAQCQ